MSHLRTINLGTFRTWPISVVFKMFMIVNVCLIFFFPLYNAVALDFERTSSGNSNSNANTKQGWTSSPDGRGTIDVLYSCGLTMFLCAWSILCLNVPSKDENTFQILWRKMSLTALGILCPELIFELAFGQWLSARQSVRDMNSIGAGPAKAKRSRLEWVKNIFAKSRSSKSEHVVSDRENETWTMKKAFFTDMGGFILGTREHSPFPLDAMQLHYLVSTNRMPLPKLAKREVEERNKVDGLLRTITLCQITWFMVNTLARRIQNLVITTAELTTVSFILCSLGTAFFWWHKPADALSGKILEEQFSINDILKDAGQPLDAWKRTPLDFVSRKEWWWSKCWSNFVSILNHMHITFGTDVTPIDRIPDSLQKELFNKQMYMCMGLTIGYFSILFLGWDYSFPTRTEQVLWRAACVTLMATLLALMIMSSLADTITTLEQSLRRLTGLHSPGTRSIDTGFRARIVTRSRRASQRLNSVFDSVRNNSTSKDPLLHVPLRLLIPIYIIAVFYCHARTYILIADIIEFRSLPGSAYATVDWLKFWPRLG